MKVKWFIKPYEEHMLLSQKVSRNESLSRGLLLILQASIPFDKSRQLLDWQVYRLIGPPKVSSSKHIVTPVDHLSICNLVVKTTYSMQIPYRWFSKYFYLRESTHATYLAYVKQQKQLGARILQERTWYKYLPKNLRSQKYIPFMECLCVKCLNFSLIVDSLHALDIVVHQRSILNVVSTICPFLVHKNDLEELPVNSSLANLVQPSVKPTSIMFGHTEHVKFL